MSKGDYESKCRLNDASHIELKWWIKNVSYKNRINTPPPFVTIYSDACPTGWGAACGNLSRRRNWSLEESQKNINYLELSCFVGLKTLLQGIARFNSLV